ncbi:MAG: dethiobiotin synthase [Chlamydiae bacterium]|nr:dethiobiotin synthase [Chlamydiota bacterium]MBI3277040.1 dethiobiotin synthase [Chlamydiota bacterium]
MNKQGVFITGTDTGVGKTLVSCALASSLSQRRPIGVMKPFSSGSREDAEYLKKFSGLETVKLDQINPVYFQKPLAPFSVKKLGSASLYLKKILPHYQWMKDHFSFVIVEGMGGLHVPIAHNFMVADLALEMNSPLVIVACPWLGTLNHTLLTFDYACSKGLDVSGIIFNAPQRKRDLSVKTNAEVLRHLTNLPILGNIPFMKGSFEEKVKKIIQGRFFDQKWLNRMNQ